MMFGMAMNMSKEPTDPSSTIDVEELALADPSRDEELQTGRVLTVVAGHAVHDTYTGFLPPLLPAFIANLALSRAEAGLLSVFLSAPSVIQPLMGHFADRVSLKVLIILGPAVTGIMMSVLGITPGYWMMGLFLIIAGLSSAGFHATAPVMISTLSGRSLGRGMGFWMVGGEIGRALGPIVVAVVIRFLDMQGIAWLIPGGLITSIIIYMRLRDIPDRRPGIAVDLSWAAAIRSMRPILLPMMGILVARTFLVPAISTYLPTYLTDEGAEIWFAGISLSLFEITGILGAFIGGSVSDRFGRKRILAISMLVASILTLLFVATDGWLQILLLPILGLAALSTTPIVMAIVLESVPEYQAMANGIYFAVSFLLRSGAVLIIGALGDRFGLGLAFQISSIIMLLGLPIIPFLPKRGQAQSTG
jgi:FSR family fosmidomycin resistance protein-like MFS transporter